MDVVLTVSGQVIVNNAGDLLYVNAAGQQIGGDQNTGRSCTELSHDDLTFTLVHITVHSRHGEVTFMH